MIFTNPLFDGIFDRTNPEDAVRLQAMIAEFKAKIKAADLVHGHLLHRWLDSSHLHVLIFDDTLEGQGETDRLVLEGYETGPFEGNLESDHPKPKQKAQPN